MLEEHVSVHKWQQHTDGAVAKAAYKEIKNLFIVDVSISSVTGRDYCRYICKGKKAVRI